MKRYWFIILILTISSCTKPHWCQTTDGKYIYGKIEDSYYLEWDGPSNAAFVDGQGVLLLKDASGKTYDSMSLSTKMGVVSDYSYINTSVGNYLGKMKKGLPNGFGVLIKDSVVTIGNFKKGELSSGSFEKYQLTNEGILPLISGISKNGKVSGIAKEYHNGKLVYEGSFKRGERNGVGQEYNEGNLIYSGEWRNGKRHGDGIEYKTNGLITYQGEWKNGSYHGRGKLYQEGICQEGRWEDGRLTKSISTSAFSEISQSTKKWFSSDSLDIDDELLKEEAPSIPSSQTEFIESLYVDLDEYLHSTIDKKVEKRFGFGNLLRMIFQPWFKSDVKRATSAQKYFCDDLDSKDVQNWINEKVDYYNSNSPDKLSYVKLEKLSDDSIVDNKVALKIFEREAMETTDTIVGILVDVIICWVIGFIIGCIIGAFIQNLIPYVGVFDLVLTIIAFLVGLYVCFFRTVPLSIELESTIKQMLVDNYILFLDAQNIVSQLLGL